MVERDPRQPYHIRRRDKAVDDQAAIDDILLRVRVVSLAMCRDDEPYLVMLNHGYDAERRCLYFHCAPHGRKIDILRANPRVWGMAVEDLGYQHGECDHAYRSVMFGGRVELLEAAADKRRALELMIRQHEGEPERVMGEQLTATRIAATTIGRIAIDFVSAKESLPRDER